MSPPKVSLTMVVRDEQENLPHCLGSGAGLFDEIVVVDTGSRDRTRDIAREFGARVFDFLWVDDFAATRNAALARAIGDYACWLDADNVVDSPQRAKLEALLDGLRGPARCREGEPPCEPGLNDQAANRWRTVLAECPDDREARNHLEGSAARANHVRTSIDRPKKEEES